MPELDTIRGLAILGVVLYHTFYWAVDMSFFSPWKRGFLSLMSTGQFGVNLFFVLSGFLITGILLDSRERTDYYGRFYYRRSLRILPAYYFTIFLLIVFGMTSRGFLLMSLAYSANLSGLFGIVLSYPVLWSLAVEEHFYLLWPATVKRLGSSTLLVLLAGIVVLCPVSRYLYHLHAVRVDVFGDYGYYTWNNADGLALGAIIAILVRKKNWGRSEVRRLAMAAFLLALLVTAVGYPGILTRWSGVGEALQIVPWNLAFGGLLCLFLLLGSSRWKRVVTPAPLIFFGSISYGLYLYHLIVYCGYDWMAERMHLKARLGLWEHDWLRALLAGGTAVLVSYLSRKYFEGPFLRLKDMFPRFLRQSKAASGPKRAEASGWMEVETEDNPSSKVSHR